MSICGLESLEKVQYIIAPKEIESTPFEDIKLAIERFVLPKSNVTIIERANFYSLKQEQSEKEIDFLIRLREKATYCDFDSLKSAVNPADEMIRAAFIAGLRNPKTKAKILGNLCQKDYSTEEILQCIQQFDDIEEFTERYQKEACDAENMQATKEYDNDVNYVTRKSNTMHQQYPSSRNVKGDVITNCNFCGGSHAKRQCPAFKKSCKNCGKINHFAKVCRSTRISTNYVDKELISANDESFNVCDVNPEEKKTCIINVMINDKHLKMQQDTGSTITIISSKMWKELNKPTLQRTTAKLQAYDGHTMSVLGKFTAVLEHEKRFHPITITVVESTKSFGLLGRDYLFDDNSVVSIHASDIETPVKPNQAYLPAIKGVTAKIELIDGARNMFCRARPVPIPLEEKVNEEIERLQQMGVITPVEFSDNASPVVWVRKTDGSLRMCADYKVHMNKKIKSDAFPLPTIETIFAKLKNANKFAKLDLRSAYWQIEMDESSKKLSTINTSKGLFQVNRLQMGMKNSSCIFQRVMETILKDLKGILIYQDDIAVFAENELSLNKRLNSVKKRLQEKGISLNEAKCIERVDEISFLGFNVSATGIRPDEKLVARVKSISKPKNVKQVEAYIGLVNFFGRLIPRFSDLVYPLNELRKKGVPFIWSKQCNDAFENLKNAISTSPVVQPYSLEKEATLTTDASKYSLAAVLTQEDHPVIYISRNLTQAEKNYSNIEREALAIVWAATRLKDFLLGRKFSINTDHKPLQFLFGENKEIPHATASCRIIRWALTLMQYDYEIKHIPGKNIPHADALTRLEYTSNSDERIDGFCNSLQTENEVGFQNGVLHRNEIKSELSRDSLLQRIMWRVVTGNWSACSQAERPYKLVSRKLTIDDGMLFHGTRLVIPYSLRKKVFDIIHRSNHSGIHSTFYRISLDSWWPGMFGFIQNQVNKCHTCNEIRPRIDRNVDQWPKAKPFERVHMDWAYIRGECNLLIIVDAGSGWIEAFPLRNRQTTSVISCLRSVFSRFGVPEVVVTDNAPEFVSSDLSNWLENIGCRKLESPIYHPRANGAAERSVQTVKRALNGWNSSNVRIPFSEFLKKILFHHRVSSHSRGLSPSEIVFGRQIRCPIFGRFNQGESVVFRPNADHPSTVSQYVMPKGRNTSWILKDNSLTMASDSQLGPTGISSTDGTDLEEEEEEANANGCEPTTPREDINEEIRRSTREKSIPVRYGFTD